MSDITQLLERSEIAFPRPLSLEDTVLLFDSLARNLKAEINYTKETRHRVDARGKEYTGHETANVLKTEGSIKLSGSINMPQYNHRSDSFSCPTVFIDADEESMAHDRITGIRFFTTPGYGLEELPEDSLKLMDAVRAKVDQYFNPRRQ